MTSPIQKLMAQEVDRKQFLLHAGAVILALTGVSGLIKALTEPTSNPTDGYDSSAYGGKQGRL